MKPPSELTLQEIFNISAVHLLTQREKSDTQLVAEGDLDYMCLYRGANGKMCAAGPLIPQEKWHPEMEGCLFCDANRIFGLGYLPIQLTLIGGLQEIHDLFEPNRWKGRLFSLAVVHGLSTEAIDNLPEITE